MNLLQSRRMAQEKTQLEDIVSLSLLVVILSIAQAVPIRCCALRRG